MLLRPQNYLLLLQRHHRALKITKGIGARQGEDQQQMRKKAEEEVREKKRKLQGVVEIGNDEDATARVEKEKEKKWKIRRQRRAFSSWNGSMKVAAKGVC